MSEHIKALFEGQELSEEFKVKTSAIFEAALEQKAVEIRESVTAELQEDFVAKTEEKLKSLDEATQAYIAEEVLPTIDKYLTAAVNEWIVENRIALESGSKVALAESFLTGLVGLAESHNLSIPEGNYDKLAELEASLTEMKETVNTLTTKNIELQTENTKYQMSEIVKSLTQELSESQVEKFLPVVDKVEFKSVEQYSAAVKSLVESYYPAEAVEAVVKDEEKPAVIKESTKLESYASSLLAKALA